MKVEFIGYNDSKAIGIYGLIKMFPVFIASFICALLTLIPTLIFHVYELLCIFILPTLILITMIFQYIVNCNYKSFLKDSKIKHKFSLKDGVLFKDGKKVKTVSHIRVYKFKRFVFLELNKSYYRIMNSDFIVGSRAEFLSQISLLKMQYLETKLPPKTDEEITLLLFSKVNLKDKEKLFYSQDKKRIVYIYKNSAGCYSVCSEKMYITYGEERNFTHEYGWWEGECGYAHSSFYGTVQEALNDIEVEIRDLIEMK